jgi:uncharacterized protein YbbC (DUF1343 family)
MRRSAALAVLAAALLADSAQPPVEPVVVPGLDVLREIEGAPLRGKRLGLITNHTGRDLSGKPAARVLKEELGLDLRALFSPEHGIEGQLAAGVSVASATDAASGLPVYSVYGETRKPTPEMLQGLDALVFDIQDIGVRFYTYISTLKLAMDAAAEAGLQVFVLDRPNPRGGLQVEGPVLDPSFTSFVGIAPVALVHGMTVGELALFFEGEGLLEGGRRGRLQVISARGWRREMTWPDTGLPWTPTSPNIRTVESAIAYPALGLFEGVNVSEGRGTQETFLIAGAPWMDQEKLLSALEGLRLPGLRFLAETFTPERLPQAPTPLYPGQLCRGFRLRVEAPADFQPIRTGLSLIATVRRLHPEQFRWKEGRNGRFVIDWLLGTDRPRLGLEAGESVEAILASLEPDLARFRERRAFYLLYP